MTQSADEQQADSSRAKPHVEQEVVAVALVVLVGAAGLVVVVAVVAAVEIVVVILTVMVLVEIVVFAGAVFTVVERNGGDGCSNSC